MDPRGPRALPRRRPSSDVTHSGPSPRAIPNDGDWEPPPGDWLARLGSPGLDVDDAVCGRVLRDLQHDPPPRGESPKLPTGLRAQTPRSESPRDSPLPRPPSGALGAPSGALGRPPSGSRILRSSPQITGSRGKLPTPPAAPRASQDAEKSDASMVTSMASRLTKVERLNAQQAATIAKKGQENDRLRLELENAKAGADGSLVAKYEQLQSDYAAVCQDKRELQKQIDEMTTFLDDYGLQWIGDDKPEGKFDKDRCIQDVDAAKKERPLYEPEKGWSIQMNQIVARISELNGIAEQDAKIVKDAHGVARFRQVDPVPIAFWADGLQIDGFPFWKYAHPSAKRVLGDLAEAYFPYCLKDKFPEGVLLKAVDKTSEPFDDKKAGQALAPQGLQIQHGPTDKERFLDRLPERVVKNGQVVNVRSEIAAVVDPTKAVAAEADVWLLPGNFPEHLSPVILQVRMEGGLKLRITCEEGTTIGTVITAVNAERRRRELPSLGPKRVLSTNMPPRAYEDLTETVGAAGLAPNAALFIRVRHTDGEVSAPVSARSVGGAE